MAKDPAMPGPVSTLEGGEYASSEEIRAEDSGETRSEIINLFGDSFGRMLLDAGYASVTSLRMASDEELLAVSGVGDAKLGLVRELVGVQDVPADEAMLPELADLPFGEPAPPGPRERAGQTVDGETATDTNVRFGEDVPDFGTEGSVSPRIARIRAAQDAAEAAAPASPVVEIEMEIEVEIEVEVEEEEVPVPPAPEEPPSDDPVDPEVPEAIERAEPDDPSPKAPKESEPESGGEENPPDYEPGPDVVIGEGPDPVAPEVPDEAEEEPGLSATEIEADAQADAAREEEEGEAVEISADDVGELDGSLLDSILEEAEPEEEAPSE